MSIGAGFDTTFWVLKSLGIFSEEKGHRYLEVDFEGVVGRKRDIINSESSMRDIVGESQILGNSWNFFYFHEIP